MAKCGGCGQFIAASASVRCSKCAGCYHRACVGVPPTATPSPTWLCPGCKATLPKTDNSATPVKGAAADYSDSHSLPTVAPSASLDLAQEIRAFREELSGLRSDIRQLRQENAEFRAANEGYNGRMGAVEGRLDNIEQRFESTDAASYDRLERTIVDLKLQLNDRDQDLLLNDVIVSGIPESKAENPAHIIKTVSLKLGIDLDDRDIVNVERLGKVRRNITIGSSQNDIAEHPRPRAIAVRLSRRVVRDQLLRAARVRRGLTTADLNLHGQPKRFVNEHLTRSNARLFHLAREAGQRSRYKYVWTREGRIYARKEDGVSAVRIRSDADINKIFGDAYRPPWLDVDTFLDSLTVSINSMPFCDYTVLLGDFNINCVGASPRDCKFNKLRTFLTHFNLNQLVTSPTHFSTNNSSLIDLVCTDARVADVKVYPMEALGAHAFITSTLRIKREKVLPRVITYRGLKNINLENFKDALDTIDWRGVVSSDDVDCMVYCLTNELLCLFDTFAPRKTVRIKDRSYPWITDNIKLMMKLRDKAYKEFRNNNTLVHKKQYYIDLKTLVNKSIYFEKVAYFKCNINNNISHPKLLWKNLKSTLLPQKCYTELPTHLRVPDRINNHFLNVPGDTTTSLSAYTYYEFHRFSDSVFTLKTTDATSSSSANVLLRGQIIERVSEARNLGLLMDEGLRFESHISSCVRNCFYRLKVLYGMRPYLSEELRVQLVESLVLSRLNYADVVIGPRLLSRTERLIQRVQNACARSFRYAASKCWNNIPPPIRNLQTTFSFKRKLKEFIFNSQIESETINIDISFI
ncbi:hypothetical protein SFRURICE_009759 [Spodoptera frugiperda]|nr:hypothetical protein SFRURICE_009759 [Spodoptera frugiperda]